MADFFAGFGLVPLPDAIAALQLRVAEKERPAGIERYALRLFDELDLDRLRAISAKGEVQLARADGFRIDFDAAATSQEDARVLYQAEAVLNRLSKIAGFVDGAPATEEDCAVLDDYAFRQVTAYVAKITSEVVDRAEWTRPGSVACEPGGEWDVRTRFAAACGGISPITHLEYAYSFDTVTGELFVRFTRPDESAMPHAACDQVTGRWRPLGRLERDEMAAEHACRLALVLAAAAFSAGPTVVRCVVQAYDSVHAGDSLGFAFERTQYFAYCVPLALELIDTPLAGNPSAKSLKPFSVEVLEGDTREQAFRNGEIPQRRFVYLLKRTDERFAPLARDTRPLPAALRELVLADTPAELDVAERAGDPLTERFNGIRTLATVDERQGEQLLRDFIAELEASCAIAELGCAGPVQSQFCENFIDRLLLPLLESDRSVRINRAPDALFFAQYELAGLYCRQGRFEEALPEARALLDVGSTSTRAHFLLINVLMRLERYDEVVEVCRHGMRTVYGRDAIIYYFYRLAFALWNTGEPQLACACYALIPEGTRVSPAAKMELHTLMEREEIAERPSPRGAIELLKAAGIPIPPTQDVIDQIADAAVLFTDAGFFTPACAATAIMRNAGGGEVMDAVRRSLMPLTMQTAALGGEA